LQQSDYTSLSWTVYLNALSAAAAVLGNPTSLDVSTTATALSNAFSSLTKTTNSVSITHLLPVLLELQVLLMV
jgi:2-methylcitrate dehydratase PrpD